MSPDWSPREAFIDDDAAAAVSRIEETYAGLVGRIDEFLNEREVSDVRTGTQAKVRESLTVINRALNQYGYPSKLTCLRFDRQPDGRWRFNDIALSFNGGKDCLVLLLLYIYILHDQHCALRPIPTCFVTPPHSFPEIDEFVTSCAKQYNLDVERIAMPMKPAFERYLRGHERVRAVLVGTRRTDPHGENLGYFDATDHGWPAFMRVQPVINWHYWEIWDVTPPRSPRVPRLFVLRLLSVCGSGVVFELTFDKFLRAIKVPYCVLYDRGFTSLGGTLDTYPNPLLKVAGGEGFKPAYELEDESQERCGRDRHRNQTGANHEP